MRATVARFLPLIVTILTPILAAAQPSGGPVPVATATGSMVKAHGKELTASALSTDGDSWPPGRRTRRSSCGRFRQANSWRDQRAKETVSQLAFTPDGRLLAASAWDKTVSVSSTEDGRLVASLTGHAKGVDSILLSPDGTVLISSGGKELRASAIPDGKLLATMPSETTADKAVFLPDGKTFAFFSQAKVRFVSVPDLRDAGMLDCTSGGLVPPKPAISADGTKLVVACNGKLTVWSLPDRRLLTTIVVEGSFQPDPATQPRWGDCRNWRSTGPVRLWDLAEGRAGAVLHGHSGPVVSLAFTPDGKRLVSGSWDGSVRVWSVDEGTALTIFQGHRGGIKHLHITPDGSTIVSGQTSTLAIVGSTSVRNVKADALIAFGTSARRASDGFSDAERSSLVPGRMGRRHRFSNHAGNGVRRSTGAGGRVQHRRAVEGGDD